MEISAEVYSNQEPPAVCDSTASSNMDRISTPFPPLNPYSVPSVASGIMPLQIGGTNVPPPVLDISDVGFQEQEAIQFNNYSLSPSAGGYQYTDYDAASNSYYEQGSVGPHDISSREGTSTPEFGHRNMHLYHQHTPQPSITSP